MELLKIFFIRKNENIVNFIEKIPFKLRLLEDSNDNKHFFKNEKNRKFNKNKIKSNRKNKDFETFSIEEKWNY